MTHCTEIEFATLETLRANWSQMMNKKRARSRNNPFIEDLHIRISNDMLPMLVHLLHERRDCNCIELISTVQRIIIDHQFYENTANQDQWHRNVDEQVELILKAMQATCEKLIKEGEWSSEPMAPMMFG